MTKIEELYDKLFLNPKTEGDHAFNKELIRQGFQDMLAPKEIPMTASRIAKSICMAWEEVLRGALYPVSTCGNCGGCRDNAKEALAAAEKLRGEK